MFIVRFIRKDNKQDEEYYYSKPEDARYHFSLFATDDSDLYRRIELIDEDKGEILDVLQN